MHFRNPQVALNYPMPGTGVGSVPSFFTKCNITSSPAGCVDVRKPLKVQRTLLLNATEPTLCCMSSFHRWIRRLGSETACAFACWCRKLRSSMTMESNFDRRNLSESPRLLSGGRTRIHFHVDVESGEQSAVAGNRTDAILTGHHETHLRL